MEEYTNYERIYGNHLKLTQISINNVIVRLSKELLRKLLIND